ncbi:MAG: response regulator transcription factor [Spirochaetales bacterium]|nr:response regulator transcription factor [Spirochaetales bacterium]
MQPIKVLIADDQHLFAQSLRFVLQNDSNGRINVIGIAENGKEAVAQAQDLVPDVILMDIRMPVMDGVEATDIIRKQFPDIKILILTTFDDDELAVDALNHGATGYVLKEVDPQDLILSIEAVHKGAFYMSPSIGFKLLDLMHPDEDRSAKEKESLIFELLQAAPDLTRREAEIVCLTAKAQTNAQIADSLFIAEKTVKNHLVSIYDKLSVHNRLSLIKYVSSLRQRVYPYEG